MYLLIRIGVVATKGEREFTKYVCYSLLFDTGLHMANEIWPLASANLYA